MNRKKINQRYCNRVAILQLTRRTCSCKEIILRKLLIFKDQKTMLGVLMAWILLAGSIYLSFVTWELTLNIKAKYGHLYYSDPITFGMRNRKFM